MEKAVRTTVSVGYNCYALGDENNDTLSVNP